MKTKAVESTPPTEATILARVLGNDPDPMPPEIARHILSVDFSESDKARVNDLLMRNQQGTLSAVENEELSAYITAGSVLSILSSKARRALKIKPKKRSASAGAHG